MAAVNQVGRTHDLSVIVPMDDDHGFGEACIESWNKQQHPRERIQLVVIDPGNQRGLIERVRPHLAAHDLLIIVPTDNEGLLYERGAHAAQSDILFTTEGHCVAEPIAAAEILRLFKDPAIAAVNGKSTHIEPTIIAKQQSLLEREWVDLWPVGHWQTVSLRAFAVRRHVYARLGGFRPEYRRFCANAFVIELERRALRLAPTQLPVVRHCNSPTIRDVAVTLRDSARGQIVWRSELDGKGESEIADRYVRGLDFWNRRGDLERNTAQILAGSLLRSLFAGPLQPGIFRRTIQSLATLVHLAAAIVVGPRISAWAQRAALGWAMASCFAAARLVKTRLLNSYRRLWCKSFDRGFADHAVAYPLERQWFTLRPEGADLAAIPDGAVAGFYARETWGPEGPWIRWSGCVFLLRLCLSPDKSHRITLDLRSIARCGERFLHIFFNGSILPRSAIVEETETLKVILPAELCRFDGRQELVFTCRTVQPSARGEADRRRLGLAVFSIRSE